MKGVLMKNESDFVPLETFSGDGHCFACGAKNPFGLHMKFLTDGSTVRCNVSVPGYLCGWGDLVHGGIISTLLDETMSWTTIHLLRRLILTRTMEVEFILPVAPNTGLRTEGRVEQRIKNTEALVSAVLLDASGRPCARAKGRFALISVKMMRRLKIMGEQAIADFERFYGAS
jgi:acyl-coenzyme A thioesterase PaaI-like protein